MRASRFFILSSAIAIMGLALQSWGQRGPSELTRNVSFASSDGVRVFAALSGTSSHHIIIMFHQPGSNASEYGPIVRRAYCVGCSWLAVDLRSGGRAFGSDNPTAAQFSEQPFESAYKDMEAAIAWGAARYNDIIVWGSSSSASLCLRLASEHPEISAVIAFSPGDYFSEPGQVAKWASRVKVPVFIACTATEVADARWLAGNLPAGPNRERDGFVSDSRGVHGSSALREDLCPSSAVYSAALTSFFSGLGLRDFSLSGHAGRGGG